MQPEERLKHWKLHDSIRGWFGRALYQEMILDDRIFCLTGDLGFGLLDPIRDDFPDRFLNVGASEQLLVGAGVGLSLSGCRPFVYSITTFLIYRAFEWIRNYLHYEQLPVFLIGSGMDDDYKHDGITHQPFEVEQVLNCLPNIRQHYPQEKETVPSLIKYMITENKPAFMCLRR